MVKFNVSFFWGDVLKPLTFNEKIKKKKINVAFQKCIILVGGDQNIVINITNISDIY